MSISNQLKQYKNKNIHIIGIGGAEGSAIAEFLVSNGISSITGHDFSSKRSFKKAFFNTHLSLKPKDRMGVLNHLLELPIKINFKDHYLEGIEEADMVFVSQVWFKYTQNMPILEKIKDIGVPFKTITNLYFELAPCPIISVTGTNGKTTVSRLIYSIFKEWEKTLPVIPTRVKQGTSKRNGRISLFQKNIYYKHLNDVKKGFLNFIRDDKLLENERVKSKIYFAGNDRQNIQVLDKLGEMEKENVLILETSSTQLLLNSGISPHIGIITNISPNHLDDHGSFENYIEAKKNLIRYQKKGDFAILNYNNNQTKKIAEEFQNKAFLFSIKDQLVEGCFIKDNNIIARKNNNETILLSIDDIKIPGKHNLENVLAAASCAHLYGIKPEIIKDGISKYIGIKHRLKLLYNINGIKYYDDTQATTPEATIAGIESFDGDIILLSGGDDKGMQYKKLAERINDKVKFLILFPGDASEKIEELIDRNKVNFIKVKDFSEAIKILKRYYKKTDLTKGGAVLISPGSAHFYSKYVENTNKDLREWIKLMKQ